MPFAKRVVEPQLLCRYNEEGVLFEDLVSISNVALSRTLRQLSDLAKHACSIFQELENNLTSTSQRLRALQGRIGHLQDGCTELDAKQEAVPVSNLDVESKLTQHFQAPFHLQRNIFRLSTRPACVEELHHQATFSLWAVHRDHQRRQSGSSRERRVTISISAVPPMPMVATPPVDHRQNKRGVELSTFESTRSSSPTECCRFSPWSRKATPSDPDTDGVALGHRSKFPIPNIPSTLDKQTNWSKALPLPTPEERMKCNSQVITSCVIPINVTGVGFDRDASVRCSLVYSQSLLQRRRKLRRRRTVAGVPRQVHQDLDSDDSPSSRERTVIVHASSNTTPSNAELANHLNTRDSGCQTEDCLIPGAPSRRKIRSQRGQGFSLSFSHSAGNITSLSDSAETMFTTSVAERLRSRSLPRDASCMIDNGHNESDEEELPSFDAEGFLPGSRDRILKDEEESTDDQAVTSHQHGSLKYTELSQSPERSWMERTRSHLPRNADMSSCEISSSSDTFSSPVHSVSAAGVLGGPMDHKDDHQSSSGNWSGSSSTCPSQTSETILPTASPPLTGSSHCDSELSLNATPHAMDDQSGLLLDHYQSLRTQRTGSFSSTAMDILEEVGVVTPIEVEWCCHPEPPRPQDFSPEPSREAESSLDCPSFTSMATCESSFSDKPPSEKADSVSHYSVDTEGYFTSMHFDCGLKGSRSFTYNYAHSDLERSHSELSGHMTLGRRCLSLRKPKAKPSPPKRSSSLRKICSDGNIADKKEPKIKCEQKRTLSSRDRRLQLTPTSSLGHIESSTLGREPFGMWGVEGSTDLPDLGVLSSTDGHSFKDEGVVQSDYADLWLLNDLKANDPYRSLSNSSTATGTTVIECFKSQESCESQTSQSGSRATTPSLPSVEGELKLTSPENLAGLASPSSGYSSQSETPTSSFPTTFFPGPLSPASGKRKPKVPERKSSLSSLSLQSLSSRDRSTSKGDLELPDIPPSGLDLSVLHSMSNKTSAYKAQIQSPHQNKQKLTNKHIASSNSEVFSANSFSITPMVLHSVRLRSVAKDLDDKHEMAPILQSITANLASTISSSKSLDPESTGLCGSESCESTFTSNEELASGETYQITMTLEEEAETPLGSVKEGSSYSESGLDQTVTNISQRSNSQEIEASSESEETLDCFGDFEPESENLKQQVSEFSEDETFPSPPVLHSSPKRSSSMDEVPDTDCESDTSEVSLICGEGGKEIDKDSSNVSAESGSQDSKEESTVETEYPSKDSTPESTESPQPNQSMLEDDNVFLSPNKSRTTEDLFAVIHRSKRKVLGRKDSTELGVRNRLVGASGNTPPSSTANSPVPMASPCSTPITTPPSLQRFSSPIYRNAKKSSTSNEEFKLLLLKKGSRSESSYRMSAKEILKSPVTPKSSGDCLIDSSGLSEEPVSPLLQQHAGQEQFTSSPYPKANTEGFSSKAFPTSASSRQGRSRIPPPANSSRYGMRSRFFSAPMQAISEGEAENSDGSPHDDSSSQGST
ncbi:Nance-Horan syndrome protein [Gouania willdenowi]|uniref:Nance-Horan syndrome protein n=1 Tax=Gouania willdenowi TaxID=441366 RepID=UPI0010549F43|nr:Nance-Horan syndrome protein [Gouania willdenowi]